MPSDTLTDFLPDPEPPAAGSVRVGRRAWMVPGIVEYGLWCDRCLLPSLSRYRIHLLRECRDCGQPEVIYQGVAEFCDEHDEAARWAPQ